jgi:hypothetical protein
MLSIFTRALLGRPWMVGGALIIFDFCGWSEGKPEPHSVLECLKKGQEPIFNIGSIAGVI